MIALGIDGIIALLLFSSGFNPWLLHLARVLIPSLINITPILLPPLDIWTIVYLAGFALLFLFYFLLQMLLASTVIKQTADLSGGLQHPLSENFQFVWRQKRSIFGAYLLATLIPPILLISGIFLPLFLPLLLGFWVMTTPQLLFWLSVVIFSTIITSVATLLVVVRLAIYLPIAVLETRSSTGSLQKSWQATKGNGWHILALLLLVNLVVISITVTTAVATFWAWLMPMPPYYPIFTAILDSLVISLLAPLAPTISTMLYQDLANK